MIRAIGQAFAIAWSALAVVVILALLVVVGLTGCTTTAVYQHPAGFTARCEYRGWVMALGPTVAIAEGDQYANCKSSAEKDGMERVQ